MNCIISSEYDLDMAQSQINSLNLEAEILKHRQSKADTQNIQYS